MQKDAEELIRFTASLARHVELGEQLLQGARERLGRTQNAETCDGQPPQELWEECRNIIEACGTAIDKCKGRSRNLRWDPVTTSRE